MIPLPWSMFNIMIFFDKSGLGEVMTLFDDNPTILEECQLCMHVDYDENILCSYIIESGFGRVSNLDPTYLDNVQSYDIFDKSGFGKVMTLVNDNPTILEECQPYMHVDHVENMLCDIYIVEFAYDHTCNYY